MSALDKYLYYHKMGGECDICSFPSGKCSCGRDEAAAELAQLRAKLTPMQCGHIAANVVNGDEGTSYCAICAMEAEIESLRAELAAKDAALRNLEYAERQYRCTHDKEGGTDIRTGHAWDYMRRCGDRARELLTVYPAKEGEK